MRSWWLVSTTYPMYSRHWFCSPGLSYDRQTDRQILGTYLPTYYPLNKTLFCDCEMIHLQRGILRSSFAYTFEGLMDDGDTCTSFSFLVGWKGASKRIPKKERKMKKEKRKVV